MVILAFLLELLYLFSSLDFVVLFKFCSIPDSDLFPYQTVVPVTELQDLVKFRSASD